MLPIDSLDADEIEITPEMIEAGKVALCDEVMLDQEKEKMVIDIYRAMRRARPLVEASSFSASS